jgi:hypothetical protein
VYGAALVAVSALLRRAAPDVDAAAEWSPQDLDAAVGVLRQSVHASRTAGADSAAASSADASSLVNIALQGCLAEPRTIDQRVQELRTVAAGAVEVLLPALEQLVAAEYTPRGALLLLQPPGGGQHGSSSSGGGAAGGGTAALPSTHHHHHHHVQASGMAGRAVAAASTSIAGAGGVGRPESAAAVAAARRLACEMGDDKLRVLGGVYALLLRAGLMSWPALEQRLLAPAAPGLSRFVVSCRSLLLRRVVAVLAAATVAAAPSTPCWSVITGTSTTPRGAPPPGWLLRLWVGAMFDAPTPLARVAAWHLGAQLAELPATAPLFDAPGASWLRDAATGRRVLQGDRSGRARALLLQAVASALLHGAGRAAEAGSTAHAPAPAAAAAGLQDLRDLLTDLPALLRARQSELQACGQPRTLLRWQRSCTPGLLALVELAGAALAAAGGLAGAVTPAASLAPALRGAGARQGPAGVAAGGVVGMVAELRRCMREMVVLLNEWMRAGVVALCGLSSRPAPPPAQAGVSGATPVTLSATYDQALDMIQACARMV